MLTRSSVLGIFPLNLYLFMLAEVLMSLEKRCFEYLYREQKQLPKRELAHLSRHYDLRRIKKVVVVGAGAIPYTALIISEEIKKPVFAVERNAISYFACLRLLNRLKASKVRAIRATGQLYDSYENSLVIITLHTRLKQEVMHRALTSNSIVVVRQPLGESRRFYESADVKKQKCTVIVHEAQAVVSVFITNKDMENSGR